MKIASLEITIRKAILSDALSISEARERVVKLRSKPIFVMRRPCEGGYLITVHVDTNYCCNLENFGGWVGMGFM